MMKKRIYLTLMAVVAVATGAFASSRERNELPRPVDFKKHEIGGEITLNGQTYKLGRPEMFGLESTIQAPAPKTRAIQSSPMIVNAPGVKTAYTKDVIGYSVGAPFNGYGVAAYINWDGNDAYFYDIITGAPMERYVKGTKDGNKITLPMNQNVLEFDDEEYDLVFGLLRPVFSTINGSIYVWFYYSDDYDSITFSQNEEGTWLLDNLPAKYTTDGQDNAYYNFPNYVIGYFYSDEGDWSGYNDVMQAYDLFDHELVTMPEGLETRKLTYINGDGEGVIVDVATTADAVYVKGLSAYAPDAVFKADIVENGTKLTVAPEQFIGLEQGTYFILTATCEVQNGRMAKVDADAPFLLEKDADGKILSIKSDDSGLFLVFNDDPVEFWPMDVFMDLNLSYQETFYGVPSTPGNNSYYEEYADLMGANFLFFTMSSFANNGDIIDVNNLYYAVFVNGEPVEFEETEGFDLLDEEVTMYKGIKTPTYLVPYTFANSTDLYEDSGGMFIVGLYVDGIENVGVQGVYLYEGKEIRGQLLTIDAKTGQHTISDGSETKVESIATDIEGDGAVYNLQGVKVANPSKGLYIINGKKVIVP